MKILIPTLAMMIFQWSAQAKTTTVAPKKTGEKPVKVIVQDNQEITFEGRNFEGDLNSPGGFYIDVDPRQKFDPLTRKRKDFRREMLRDSVQSY